MRPAGRRPRGSDAVRELRSRLLGPTLANALRTPFYRTLLGALDLREFGTGALADLPIVDKAQIAAAGRAAQVRAGLVCDEIFTSGTTGRPLVTACGDREQAYIREFFNAIHAQGPPALRPRGVMFNNPYHGYQVGVPTTIHFHRLGIYDEGSFEHARRLLEGEHDDAGVEPHCTLLVGLERALRAFGQALCAACPEGLRRRPHAILSYSQYLTAHARRHLRDAFGGQVIDRFSMTEIFGGATECHACGFWHFDPYVLPEVVAAHTRAPLREGLGILLMTALYPFQEAQPMVRYWTGDLVEVTHESACQPGLPSIRPRGRARFGVPEAEGDGWLLTPAEVLESLDDLAGVARLPRFLDAAQVRDAHAIGHPRYRVVHQTRAGRVEICVEVECQPASAAALTGVVRARLAASPRLSPALTQGRATLEVRPAQALQPDLIAHAE